MHIRRRGYSFHYARYESEMTQLLNDLAGSNAIAFDIESCTRPEWDGLFKIRGKDRGALNPHTGEMSLFIFQARNANDQISDPIILDILSLKESKASLEPLRLFIEQQQYCVAHYAQFDAMFLRRHLGKIPNNLRCTRTMSQLIGNALGSKAARARGHSLADLCRDWLNVSLEGKGSLQVSTWRGRPWDSQIPESDRSWLEKLIYAQNDTRYLFPLHDLMLPVIVSPLPETDLTVGYCSSPSPPYGLGMRVAFAIDQGMIPVVAEEQYCGMAVSQINLDRISQAILDPEYPEVGELTAVASRVCLALGLDCTPSPWTDILIPTPSALQALNNPVRLKSLLGKAVGVHKLDTAQAAVLERLAELLDSQATGTVSFASEDEQEQMQEILGLEASVASYGSTLCKDLIRYKRLQKLLSIDLRTYINPATKRIHPTIQISGAATGRSSSSDPNGQNISGRTKVVVELQDDELFVSDSLLDQHLCYVC